jgi:hypothetical protein
MNHGNKATMIPMMMKIFLSFRIFKAALQSDRFPLFYHKTTEDALRSYQQGNSIKFQGKPIVETTAYFR